MPTKPFPEQLRQRDLKRLNAYKANLEFYQGQQWLEQHRRRQRRLTFNYARAAIDKVSALVSQGYVLDIIPHNDTKAARSAARAAQQAYQEIADANHLKRLDYDTEIDTAVLGDGAFKLTWDDAENRVIITAPDMQGIFPWPHPHDLTTFVRVAHRYELPRDEVQRLWGVRPAKDTAVIVEDWTADSLTLWIDNSIHQILDNPYRFIPFIIFPNQPVPKQWNGLSDIDAIRDTTQELNRQLTRLSQILEVSGNPIAVLEGITESQDIAVGPGAVWELPEGAKAYLLDLLQGGGVQLHIEYANLLYQAFHDLSEVPRAAFAGIQRDLSGVALEIELRPLTTKVERKRLIRHAAYIRRARLALQMLDHHTRSKHSTTGRIDVLKAQPVTPPDKNRDGGREVALVGAGLSSRKSAMARMAFDDPTAEFEEVKKEARELALIAADIRIPFDQTPLQPR